MPSICQAFFINSVNGQGHKLHCFYTNSPDMQKLLFEHGLVPELQQEANQAVITEVNILKFVECLDEKLIQHVNERTELKEPLLDFALGMVDITKPENIKLKQKDIFENIHQVFKTIKDIIPNYSGPIPTANKYKVIIDGLLRIKAMEDFAREKI